MKCQECEASVRALKEDPRNPPLDTKPCLCEGCYQTAAIEEIELCEIRIDELKRSLTGPLT